MRGNRRSAGQPNQRRSRPAPAQVSLPRIRPIARMLAAQDYFIAPQPPRLGTQLPRRLVIYFMQRQLRVEDKPDPRFPQPNTQIGIFVSEQTFIIAAHFRQGGPAERTIGGPRPV